MNAECHVSDNQRDAPPLPASNTKEYENKAGL